MGLKSNVKPAPIVVENSKDTTPSVTPMRPTPLVGNWCDLPWGAECEAHNVPSGTPAKPNTVGPSAYEFFHSVVSPDSCPSKSDIATAPQQVTATKSTHATISALPSEEDTINDLFLVTPADTMLPEDFEDLPSKPTEEYYPSQMMGEAATLAHTTLPSRAHHFVDFSRLPARQTAPQLFIGAASHVQPPAVVPRNITTQPPAYSAATAIPRAGRPAQQPPQQQHQQQQPSALTVNAQPVHVVLVSRFPPPPPPNRITQDTLLRNGSSFESYYAIIMRWYARVCHSLPRAHPTVPPCPPAEQYLHDFYGWVELIDQWWAKNFTRRPKTHVRMPPQNTTRSNARPIKAAQ